MREDAKEFGDPLVSVCATTQQELKIAERVAAYNAGDMDKVTCIDERKRRASQLEEVSSQYPKISCRCIQSIVPKG